MLKFLNSQSKTVTSAAIVIAGATLINKFVGLARDRTIAHYFGAGPVTDAYYAAFKIPDLIYSLLVVGALTAGFIPTFTKLLNRNDNKQSAWRLSSNIVNILGLALIIFCSIGAIFAPQVARIVATGFSAENLKLVTVFTRILFISPFFLGLSMVMGGILQSLRQFMLYSIAPIFYNLGIIFGAVVLVPMIGVSGLAWGVIIGAFFHFILQYFGAYQAGYRWAPILDWHDRETIHVGKLMIPRTLGLAVTQTNAVITAMLASFLPIGSVAAFNFANNLYYVPVSIIGISFAMAALPILSHAAAQDNKVAFSHHLNTTIRQIIFMMVPFMVVFLLLRAQIIRVVLGSGQFDWNATITTADAFAFFSLNLLPSAIAPLLARAFFSLSDTKTPLWSSIIGSVVSITTALILMKSMQVSGLALADAIGGAVNMTLLLFLLHKKSHSLDFKGILSSLSSITVAALIMAITIQLLKYPLARYFNLDYFWGVFGQGMIAGASGLVIYLIICYIFKLPELSQLLSALERRWLKLRHVQATEIIEVAETTKE